jgi:transcriptional regulator GlxA family with amidase domain
MTPVQYIRTLKLNRAAELMEKTDYTISQITYEVGFQDLRYFRNIFKEHFNCTPSEYLAKLKAKK